MGEGRGDVFVGFRGMNRSLLEGYRGIESILDMKKLLWKGLEYDVWCGWWGRIGRMVGER